MKCLNMRWAAVGMAALGMLLPPSLVSAAEQPAGPTVAPAPLVADVALGAGGTLNGQVVTTSGQGVAGVPVSVCQQETILGTTVTGVDGRFAMTGLPGGVFQIVAGQGQGIFRLWAPDTAPPAAQPAALVVQGGSTVRGGGPLGGKLFYPLVIAGIVALAVAIPIAIHSYNVERRESSS